MGFCCGPADDSGFIRALIDRLGTQTGIDQKRIFVTGFSGGGAMAHRVACDLSDRVAAIASVSGAFVAKTCQPARPISIYEMHGTADTTTPMGEVFWARQHRRSNRSFRIGPVWMAVPANRRSLRTASSRRPHILSASRERSSGSTP